MNENESVSVLAAKQKFTRADKLLRWGFGTLIVFVLLIIAFTSVQVYTVQNTIAQNQKINSQASTDRFEKYNAEAARQQQITQQYIKCVASTLVIPIADRDPNAFDTCSKTAQSQNLSGQTSTTPAP